MQRNRVKTLAAGIATLALPATAAAAQTETVLYSFASTHGEYPRGRLLLDKSGALFGTTSRGGASGVGTVYTLVQSKGAWHESILHSFSGIDGKSPSAGLIHDSTGALYATTVAGGSRNRGTAFALTETGGAWTEQVLDDFGGTRGGFHPESDLIADEANGALYGTTSERCGAVFELSQSGGVWSGHTLFSFAGGDGCLLTTGVHQDSAGSLYGVTFGGGYNNENGTVFQLTHSLGNWSEQTLYSFGGGADGQYPIDLAMDSTGTIYVATENGGPYNLGTVVELTPSQGAWSENVIHTFDRADGANPTGLHLDKSTGALYVTSIGGGTNLYYGTVIELSRSHRGWSEKVLHSFGSGTDGRYPDGRVIEDTKTGTLYGTTTEGGAHNRGTVYQVTR